MRLRRYLSAVLLGAIALGGACGGNEKAHHKLSNSECGRGPDGRLTAAGTIQNLLTTGLHNRNYELHVKWFAVDDEVIAEVLVDVHNVPEGGSRPYSAVTVEGVQEKPATCDVSVRADCPANTAEVGTCGRLNTGRPPPSL